MTDEKGKSSAGETMFISERPIDFSGDTDTFDRQVQQEALARARQGMNRDMSHLGGARHSQARVFDAHRYSVRTYVPEHEGAGYWDLYRLSRNMYAMIADCEYSQPKWLGTPDPGYFKIRLLRSGKLLRQDQSTLLDAPGSMLAIYASSHGGYYIAPGMPCRLVILHCRIAAVTDELSIVADSVPKVLAPPPDESPRPPFIQKLQLTPRVVNAMSDMLDSRDLFSTSLRSCFVEAKSREILASVIQGLVEEPEIVLESVRISRRERHRILEVQDIIKANLGDLPTIADLSKMVGINRTKLKSGFKAVVGCTIGEYTKQQQMEAAERMLHSSDYAISEIGYAVGYRHPANFSYAFKQFYGCLPSEMRKRSKRAARSRNSPANRS